MRILETKTYFVPRGSLNTLQLPIKIFSGLNEDEELKEKEIIVDIFLKDSGSTPESKVSYVNNNGVYTATVTLLNFDGGNTQDPVFIVPIHSIYLSINRVLYGKMEQITITIWQLLPDT